MTKEFLDKLKKINKDYYTLSDFTKISKQRREVLRVILCRLVKSGKLIRIQRNFYILPEKISEIEKIANQIYYPSYLSFESALALWGILSQIPYNLTFATILKSKSLNFEGRKIEYRKLKKELFFGYIFKNGLYLAEPEKALLDTFYLASLGKLKINFKNLDYTKIQKRKFLNWLKKYPLKTKNLIKNIGNHKNHQPKSKRLYGKILAI